MKNSNEIVKISSTSKESTENWQMSVYIFCKMYFWNTPLHIFFFIHTTASHSCLIVRCIFVFGWNCYTTRFVYLYNQNKIAFKNKASLFIELSEVGNDESFRSNLKSNEICILYYIMYVWIQSFFDWKLFPILYTFKHLN